MLTTEVKDAKGNLIPPPPPEPSAVQKWVKAAETSDDIARALKHFGQPTNWYDMWTTYEIIEDELWRNTPRTKRPKGKETMKPRRVLLMSRKWVSKDDLCQFSESCNYHRHSAKKLPTPNQRCTTDHAPQILARILQSWLKDKIP
jgi:hypothetical protein